MKSCFKKSLLLLQVLVFQLICINVIASEEQAQAKKATLFSILSSPEPFCKSLSGWNWSKKQRASDKQILTSDEKKVSQWIIDNSSCVKRDKENIFEENAALYKEGNQKWALHNESMKYNFSVESESLANYWNLLRQGIVGLYEGQLWFVHDLFSSKQAAKIKKAFDRSNFKKRRKDLISSDLEKAVCLLLNKEIDESISKWKEAIKTVEEKLNDYLPEGAAVGEKEEESFVMISKADFSWNEDESVAERKKHIRKLFNVISDHDPVMQLREMLYYFLTITMKIQKEAERIEAQKISPQTINLIDAEQSIEMNYDLKSIKEGGFLDRYLLRKDLTKLKKPIQAYIMTTAEQSDWDKEFGRFKGKYEINIRLSIANAYEALKDFDTHLANTWQAVHNGLILQKNGFKKLADSFLDEALTELEAFKKSSAYKKVARLNKTEKDQARSSAINTFNENFKSAIIASLSEKKYQNEWHNIQVSGLIIRDGYLISRNTLLKTNEPWKVLAKAVWFFHNLLSKSQSSTSVGD